MDICFNETPAMFGIFHIAMMVLSIVIVCVFVILVKNRAEDKHLNMIKWFGIGMVLAEIWKQWFSLKYVFDGTYNMWFFPWQLCSIAMYCSVLIPFVKRKLQDTLLTFMATFSLLAAIMALLFPQDMLRPQILFTIHGFAYHIVMLLESALSILILSKRKKTSFKAVIVMFLILSVIAEIVNSFGHFVLSDRKPEPNMFQITPYYPSTQVVFSSIAKNLGVIPEIIIYLVLIIAMSYVIFRIEQKMYNKNREYD